MIMARASCVAIWMSPVAPLVTFFSPAKDDLSLTAAEQHRKTRLAPLARAAVAIAFRQVHGHAERTAARNDRDLVERIIGHRQAHDGVARLVIGRVCASLPRS